MLFAALLATGCMSAQAQGNSTKEAFHPHWFLQGQVGGQYTTGETDFKDLVSPNAQIAVGYQFNSLWGLRLSANAWQSKGGSDLRLKEYITDVMTGQTTVIPHELNPRWKWNYVAPALDATLDVTNLIAGYNPKRVVSFGVLAGIGANVGFNNDEAYDAKQLILPFVENVSNTQKPDVMDYYWDGSKVRPMGRVGANLDFKVSKRVKLGLEANFNFLSDKYNSKKSNKSHFDHYYNLLAGVRVDLGKISDTKTIVAPEPTVVERVVERTKVVHDTVYVDRVKTVAEVREPLRRDIFFLIRGSVIDKEEMKKVDEVVAYLNKYPDAKVTVTGYADKGTGNTRLNIGYSKKRADVVANTLKSRGVAENRIIVDAKGDTEQPYAENDRNRVTICIAE